MALRYTLFHISHIKICYLKTVVGHGGELVLGAEGNTVAHGLPHTFEHPNTLCAWVWFGVKDL
jgi:hypothetical protein